MSIMLYFHLIVLNLGQLFNTCSFFFFNDTATTEIYTLSLHDALPIYPGDFVVEPHGFHIVRSPDMIGADRKSTRLNSSHTVISYAVFCLKKKTKEAKWPACWSGALLNGCRRPSDCGIGIVPHY